MGNYNKEGDAKHYDSERLNSIIKFERIYGTLAVMTFCEINAEKYRQRLGKKQGQTVESDLMKIKWYEKAAKYFFEKISTMDEIIIDNTHREQLPWK